MNINPADLPSKLHKGTTILVLLCLSLSLAGCSTTRQIPKEEPSQWKTRSKVWIILNDGRQYRVTDPRLSDSRLTGHFHPDDRSQVELSEIESLSIKELDKTKTFLLVAWGLVATGFFIGVLIDESKSEPCST
jgi:hypothetical protein